MISVSEAVEQVLSNVVLLPSEKKRLKECPGRVLRQAIVADRDGPPFDRATLDGVCMRFSEWEAGQREFEVSGTQAAGAPAELPPPKGACLEIMTGAPVPEPCDCVLRVEDYERDGDTIRAHSDSELLPGTGVHPKASDYGVGETLLEAGCQMTGREMAVAASCGCTELDVTQQPKIAVVTTGDELVEIEDDPKPHQIRRSNDRALHTTLTAAGFTDIELNHLPDSEQAISWNCERLLQQFDAVVLTGGASKGRFDYVPKVLKELGVKEIFHGVAQRPGKPMFFGTFERPGDFLHPEDTRVVAVFALPGNPVSGFTCAHQYVLPAVRKMAGVTAGAPTISVVLSSPVQPLAKLTRFLPVKLKSGKDGRLGAEPMPFNTSGDFASVAKSDGFVEIPVGEDELPAGSTARFTPWV